MLRGQCGHTGSRPGWLTTAAVLVLTASEGFAQSADSSKSVEIPRTSRPPVIDGVIDPAEWEGAAIVEDLHQYLPVVSPTPSERTTIYLAYDEHALYVAARMWERDPQAIAANIMRQGEGLSGDDSIAVVLDTFGDGRSGYWFEVNPNGVRAQALYKNVSSRNFDWNGIWHAMSSRDSQGWTAEMVIPMKTLSFDPARTVWGINFCRKIERRREFIGWVSRNQRLNAGTTGAATGLRGLEQGMGLSLAPSVSVVHERSFDPRTRDHRLEPSLDVLYSLTPALTAALTVNTDFSATEVDDRRVNLTRFDLFFPEKRTFFLQGADIFEFGRLEENGRPFFSRRIGLSASGDPVDLELGAKLTGRIGRWSIGLLGVRQSEHDPESSGEAASTPVPATDIFVGRAVANVLEESTIGAVFTMGDPRTGLDSTVVGVDFRYLNTRLPLVDVLEGDLWYQRSDSEGIDGEDSAWGVALRTPNETGFRAELGLKVFEENFNPGLGFVNNVGIRDYKAALRYTHRSGGAFSAIYAEVDAQRYELLSNGRLQWQSTTFRPIALETRADDRLELSYVATDEALYEPFEIADGVLIPPGRYSYGEYKLALTADDHRRISGKLQLARGEFFSGRRSTLATELRWRPSPHFALSTKSEWFDVDLPEGDFITRLLQLRTDIVFSSRLAWSTLVQYDNMSEIAGINARLAWTPEAGRESFLVMNYALEDPDRDNRFESSSADWAIKAGYTFRF